MKTEVLNISQVIVNLNIYFLKYLELFLVNKNLVPLPTLYTSHLKLIQVVANIFCEKDA